MKNTIGRIVFITAYTLHCAAIGILYAEAKRLNDENAFLKKVLIDVVKGQIEPLEGAEINERTLN